MPIYGIKIPPGYRDWRLVSVAHEEGSLHSFAAILGNDVAIKAYRNEKLPFPDGTVIAALHYSHTPSAENDKVFGDPQSFVPGPQTNVQFMVKDSTKFASTGGWDMPTSTRTANLAQRQHSKPAHPATRKRLAIPSSLNTRIKSADLFLGQEVLCLRFRFHAPLAFGINPGTPVLTTGFNRCLI